MKEPLEGLGQSHILNLTMTAFISTSQPSLIYDVLYVFQKIIQETFCGSCKQQSQFSISKCLSQLGSFATVSIVLFGVT